MRNRWHTGFGFACVVLACVVGTTAHPRPDISPECVGVSGMLTQTFQPMVKGLIVVETGLQGTNVQHERIDLERISAAAAGIVSQRGRPEIRVLQAGVGAGGQLQELFERPPR